MYNIHDCQVFGLSQAIWEDQIGNYNVMILTERNISDEAYCHNRIGYDMVCFLAAATAARGAHGGMGLVFQ